MITKNQLYDELCRTLTDYEGNGPDIIPDADDLYQMLVKIQRHWEDVITAQE